MEDRESAGAAEPPAPDRDGWTSGGLWPETSQDATPSWDAWPSTSPPDDPFVEPPPPTLSDPWAESWTDEAASPASDSGPRADPERWRRDPDPWPQPPTSAPEPEPAAPDLQPPDEPAAAWADTPEPPAPSWSEPSSIAPGAWTPEPSPALRAEPETTSELEPEPEPEPPAVAGDDVSPRVEPWRTDTDPWAAATPDTDTDPWAAATPDTDTDPWAAATPETEPEAEPAPPDVDAGVEGPSATDAPAPVAAPHPIFDWLLKPDPEVEPEPEREVEPEPEPEVEPEPEPEADPDQEPEPEEVEAGTVETADEAPDAVPPQRAYDPSWSPSRWGERAASIPPPASVPVDLSGDGATDGEPAEDPAEEWAAAPAIEEEPVPAPEPAAPIRPVWLPDEPMGPAESTQVLPTSWEPPPPPVAPAREGRLDPVAGESRTRLAQDDIEVDDEVTAQPSTAEQAVPWLIGFILLLAGMVIVLLALIFAGDDSMGAGIPSPSPSAAVAIVSATPQPTATTPPATPAPTQPVASSAPTPTPNPWPEYGPLEMVYQGRAAALAPIYLLRHDFTIEAEPATMAQDPALDVRRFAWAPEGTVGAGLLADVLVSIEPGVEKRRLGDNITTITFGDGASVVYAVRITQDGTNDVANVLAIDFTSGDTTELAAIGYARPSVGTEAALQEARFADEGGPVRLYWMEDGALRLWVLGGGTWAIDPGDGAVDEADESLPVLWAPGGERRIGVTVEGGVSTIRLVDVARETLASTTVEGLVSHLRWSPDGERVAFTLGRSAAGGGVLQDLFLWDLGDGEAPTQLTNTGAAFGAEWLGTMSLWRE